jgi:aminoglycoside phosphotransferase (APT) family kinase protein
MTTLTALSTSAAQIVEALTGERPAAVRRLARGAMNVKFVVAPRAGPELVVRFYPEGNAPAAGYEADVLRRLHANAIPVARVLADARSGPPSPLPYTVYEWLAGEPMNDWRPRSAGARAGVVREVMAALERMTALGVEGHGDLVSGTRAAFDTWHDFMAQSFDRGIGAARAHATLPADLLDAVDVVRSRLHVMPAPHGHGLAWGDVREEHILVGPEERLAGLVDFEGTLAAEPALNLGYARAWYGRGRFAGELAAAYGAVRTEDRERVALYAVLRGLRIAPFAHLPLPAGRRRRPLEHVLPGFAVAARQLARALS